MAKLIIQQKIAPTPKNYFRSVNSNRRQNDWPEKEFEFEDTSGEFSNDWDDAHHAIRNNNNLLFAEPDIDVALPFFPECTYDKEATSDHSNDEVVDNIDYSNYIDEWPHPKDKKYVWHVENKFSQLKAAIDSVSPLPKDKIIRIAHLDTGYDIEHSSFPRALINFDLSRNFIEGENEKDATDRFIEGMLKNPGHGTGTLSILAGNNIPIAGCGESHDFIGLKHSVEIVPMRIATSVVLLRASGFIKAMDYIVNTLNQNNDTRIHILTMSMGGLPSKAWADLVNKAYEQGVFMVCAAGNNFNKFPTNNLVYPARFNRVVAACGVTHDFSPYAKKEGSFKIMEGNHGPLPLMKTALAAFTPNVPWAVWKKKDLFGIRGDGTSSATPQIAMAAALYYIKNFDILEKLSARFMIVEAIRFALFNTASKKITPSTDNYEEYFGNGILQANDALSVEVKDEEFLTNRKQKMDTVFFPFLRILFGLRGKKEEIVLQMLDTELMQLLMTDDRIQDFVDFSKIDISIEFVRNRKALAKYLLSSGKISQNLRKKLKKVLTILDKEE